MSGERESPRDPVLDFILDRETRQIAMEGSDSWPWSRLSGSRLSKIGYKLILLRCRQLGIEPPTRAEAREWMT